MKSSVKGIVSKEFSGKSLLDFLRFGLNISGSLIKKAKRIENGISVNGKSCFVNETIFLNDFIEIVIETENERSNNIPICEMPVEIIFEDENMMIVDKDGGIPTHPSLNNYDVSIAGAVMNYYDKKGINFVFRPVNRLDKGTSGLMIVAKNPHFHELLKKQMHSDNFRREYLAVVCGEITKAGTINAPIFREDNSIIKRTVDSRGAIAITHYCPIEIKNGKTLLKIKLETGRTHQIRVHMAYIGHPLYGDYLYGNEENDIKRPALHSYKIELLNPISGDNQVFISPMKKDIKNIF